jgi:hypothetical protein
MITTFWQTAIDVHGNSPAGIVAPDCFRLACQW